MTWSLIARDPTGALGIAIASRFFAVGALCPYIRTGAGALATQALVNPLYGPHGLGRLAAGATPQATLAELVAADEGRAHRQVHVVAASGESAAYTGDACIDWCGHRRGEGYSVAGNMLAGPEVLAATANAFETSAGRPFALRLLAALEAGDAAGGDKRGKQAAAIRIHTTEEYPALDIRVDDSEEPFRELRRLYEKSLERFQAFVACLPSRACPAGITDRAQIERAVARFAAAHSGQAAA